MSDHVAIRDVLYRYARAVDDRDFDTVRDCFAPDLVVDGWGDGSFDDRDGMLRYISGVAAFDFTMHLMLEPTITVAGDRASIVADAMLTHRLTRDDGSVYELHVPDARYIEELERRDGRWVIVRRGGRPFVPPGDVDRSQIAEAIAASVPDEPVHLLGNQYVRIDGDTAVVETYAYVGEPWHQGPTVLHHRLRRDGRGGWVIETSGA